LASTGPPEGSSAFQSIPKSVRSMLLELETEPVVPVRIGDRAGDGAAKLDGPRLALQGQPAGNDDPVAVDTDLVGLEAQLRMALGIEEVRREQVPRQRLVVSRDALDARGSGEPTVGDRRVEVLEAAAKRRHAHVANGEDDRRVNRVGRPGAGRDGFYDWCDGHVPPLRYT
jgi:hypothetical protein